MVLAPGPRIMPSPSLDAAPRATRTPISRVRLLTAYVTDILREIPRGGSGFPGCSDRRTRSAEGCSEPPLEPAERVGLRVEHGENLRKAGDVEHLPDRLIEPEQPQARPPIQLLGSAEHDPEARARDVVEGRAIDGHLLRTTCEDPVHLLLGLRGGIAVQAPPKGDDGDSILGAHRDIHGLPLSQALRK